MNKDIQAYNNTQAPEDKEICELLASEIIKGLPDAENKVWHAHPVWFIDGNPIVGYDKLKAGVRLLFWSGVSFVESGLKPGSGKFKDASITYTAADQIDTNQLSKWLKESVSVQWDYKNIVKRKGKLERIK